MLSLFKWFLKTAIFTFIVLIASALIKWNGKTLSQHIQAGLQKSQKSGIIQQSSAWSGQVIKDAQQSIGMTKANNDQIKTSSAATAQTQTKAKSAPPEIAETERDKLRSLIKELNTP